MEDRLLKLLDTEQLSSSRFADVIGVQRSSVSHILSGRNKPSFDFLQKTLKAFPLLNADWLILGEGSMYEGEVKIGGGSLFDQPVVNQHEKPAESTEEEDVSHEFDELLSASESNIPGQAGEIPGNIASEGNKINKQSASVSSTGKVITRVIVFYADNSFESYEKA
ncbi:MAG: helix-turn-helix transcriptional regulator [Bacteroidales bacterium]